MEAIIEGTEPILSRLKAAMELLENKNLVTHQMVNSGQILCHMANRGGLGLNPYNTHKVGARVQSIGADENYLDTVLFSMPPHGPMAEQTISFNQQLVEASCGLLAPVTGKEMYCSVAGGHFAAFCKAAIAGCKTCEPKLKSLNGISIDQQLLKTDKVFKKLLEQGWMCTVIHYQAQELYPELPGFIQRAKNATNSVAGESTELEVMVSISDFASAMQKQGKVVDWPSCIDAACAANPPCKPYAKALAKYAELYAGVWCMLLMVMMKMISVLMMIMMIPQMMKYIMR